jgi:pyruvate kinase
MPTSHVEPLGRVRTKIVATIGPASRSPETLRALVEAGVDVFRLNFSHGTHGDHTATLRSIRGAADSVGRVVAVLQDLCGPKIRLGPIAGGEVTCNLGEQFTLAADDDGASDPARLTCSYRSLPGDLEPGDSVLFADGTVAMRVVSTSTDGARLEVTLPGKLRSRQGINVPGAALSVEALTEKDLADLEWTRENPVDYVGLSFVRSAADVRRLREELAARGIGAKIVAKLEKPQAVDNLDAILAETDAAMVARGDLGVEIDVERVPAVQKRILAACSRARIPVITATQMLGSMESSSRPTRAEASDVFNAILDGTDAVMLSGETAVGSYPVEAVATMSRIAAEAERVLDESAPAAPDPSTRAGWLLPITQGIAEAASAACRRLDVHLFVIATHSGRTALEVSKHRNPTPTLAVTSQPEVARQMALYWGVTPMHYEGAETFRQALAYALDWAKPRGLVRTGDRVMLLGGTVPGSPVHNAMLVQEVE